MATRIADLASPIIEEDLAYVERELELEVDGIFLKIVEDTEDVSEGFGRGFGGTSVTFEKTVTMAAGTTGAFRNVDIGDPVLNPTNRDTSTGGEASGQSIGQIQNLKPYSTYRAFPGIAEMSFPGFVQKKIRLVQGMGSVAAPLAWHQIAKLSVTMRDQVALTLRGLGKKIAQAEVNSIYSLHPTAGRTSDSTGSGALAAIGSSVSTGPFTRSNGGTTNSVLTIDLAHAKITLARVRKFQQGQILAIVKQADFRDWVTTAIQTEATTKTTGAFVIALDPTGKTVSLELVDMTTGASATWADPSSVDYSDSYIVPHPGLQQGGVVSGSLSPGMYTSTAMFGPSGIKSWLLSSGTAFGIALATWGQFKSIIASVGGVLDQTTLNKYIGGFYDAYGAMYSLDSLIGTTGILTAYLDSVTPLYRYEMYGKAMRLKEGWSSFGYSYQGRDFEYLASSYQGPGRLWILKMSDGNIRRAQPPDIEGTGSMNSVPGMIQFVNPLYGGNIWSPVYNGDGARVEGSEAPFLCYREYYAEQLPGIELTDITEINA